MRLVCDLCGGGLQINSGGQGATCMVCRLNYSMDRLREKLNLQMMNVPEVMPPMPEPPALPAKNSPVVEKVVVPQVAPKTEPVITPVAVKVEPEVFQPARSIVVPKQFSLQVQKGKGDVSGIVQQGGIGLGDKVYINYDYSHPYFVSRVNDGDACVKEGMRADLYLRDCPKSVLRNVFAVIGAPRPALNGHNYPGEVEEYFRYVLEREFSNCRIETQVYKNGLRKPVDFVVYRNDAPLLAVVLITGGNGTDRSHAKRAARLFRTEGVVCTHFYREFRNDMPYVIERIGEALRGAN